MKIIREYVRDNNRNKVGMLVACPIENKVYIGWSKCNKKDDFDKKMAYELALGRALKQFTDNVNYTLPKVPTEVYYQLKNRFLDRVTRYYKNKSIIDPSSIFINWSYWSNSTCFQTGNGEWYIMNIAYSKEGI